MARDFSDLKDGDELHPYHINEIYKELRRWRMASGVGDLIVDRANSSTVPPIFSTKRSRSAETALYIQLVSVANSTFGGYAWQEVRWRSPLTVTAAGTGYSASTVTFSPTYASGSDAPTATYEVDATTGALTIVNVTHAGSKMTALTASVSGGTGATLSCILDGGTLSGGGWVDVSGSGGAVGANDSHGNPTRGDLAYEASGMLSLPSRIADTNGNTWHEPTYPAIRDSGGRLLFFCRSTFLARTASISSYPSSAGSFFGAEILEITGSASPGGYGFAEEGATPMVAATSVYFYAYNLGSTIPPIGTYILCNMVDSAGGPFFVFRYDV